MHRRGKHIPKWPRPGQTVRTKVRPGEAHGPRCEICASLLVEGRCPNCRGDLSTK